MEKYITDERTGLRYELVGDYYYLAGDDESENAFSAGKTNGKWRRCRRNAQKMQATRIRSAYEFNSSKSGGKHLINDIIYK